MAGGSHNHYTKLSLVQSCQYQANINKLHYTWISFSGDSFCNIEISHILFLVTQRYAQNLPKIWNTIYFYSFSLKYKFRGPKRIRKFEKILPKLQIYFIQTPTSQRRAFLTLNFYKNIINKSMLIFCSNELLFNIYLFIMILKLKQNSHFFGISELCLLTSS